MAGFNHDQPAPQANTATEADARLSDAPKTGFSSAPKGEKMQFEDCKGTGNTRRGIH